MLAPFSPSRSVINSCTLSLVPLVPPQGLVRLALSLHRVVVWPWLPCAAPLLRREGAARDPAAQGHAVPWDTYLNTTTALPNGMGAASLQVGHPRRGWALARRSWSWPVTPRPT